MWSCLVPPGSADCRGGASVGTASRGVYVQITYSPNLRPFPVLYLEYARFVVWPYNSTELSLNEQ